MSNNRQDTTATPRLQNGEGPTTVQTGQLFCAAALAYVARFIGDVERGRPSLFSTAKQQRLQEEAANPQRHQNGHSAPP